MIDAKSSTMVIPLTATMILTGFCAVYLKFTQKKKSEVSDNRIIIDLPIWATNDNLSHFYSKTFNSDEEMMELAIYLSSRNMKEGTGGPFGTAIFERNLQTNKCKLISIGVNRVVPLGNSTLHGETVAIQFAQMKLATYSLARSGDIGSERQFELFTSCEPCAMCLGAVLWSGVSRIVCGATKAHASKIGFDEGPVYEKSYKHLENAGIAVKKHVLEGKAAEVLNDYGKTGLIYNR
mmetsp:Transcript_2574/g.3646  ORF Transcript_2574/g.3646 Transcript_2574/m.3646 type:complete len:236 (+) Transcript_2574:3-710(+)